MSLGGTNYDPQEEEGRGKQSHISKRDLTILAVFAFVAIIALIPVYRYLMAVRDSHLCTQNLLDIGTAMESYAADNDDHFPPVYMVADDGVGPKVFDNKAVFSWVSAISQYTKKSESFKCPAAEPNEGVLNLPGTSGPDIVSDYGMYAGLSTASRGSIPQIANVILITDTDNQGADNTYDPLPLKDSKGNPVPDGMVIGLNNTNLEESNRSLKTLTQAKFATRIAFPDSAKGDFGDSTITRHPDGINVLMADLHREHLHGPADFVSHPGNNKGAGIVGFWAVP